jgi:3-hydroxyisobutyrate dehydrogenase-like beta-hydroxyacid dehydrogenase
MGAAIGRRLHENGVQVFTSLTGRSAESQARARDAGLQHRPDEELARCDIFLSIVPPSEALDLARRFALHFKAVARAPVYVDCNAISPATVKQVEAALDGSGAAFVDAGIIGGPPKPGTAGPALYCSGEAAGAVEALGLAGLRVRIMPAPIGAASAFKMTYGGINKGLCALAATMMLAANRHGVAHTLHTELGESMPHLLKHFEKGVPDMYGKAYRWIAEMREIAEFLGDDDPGGRQIYEGIAQSYEQLTADVRGPRQDIAALDAFLQGGKQKAAQG